jgi:hypothetical protein
LIGERSLAAGRQQRAFGVAVGVAEFDAHQEAVKLRLGQRKGADLVRRVLGRDHEEGLGQRAGFALDRDLTLLHGFEQGALRLRGGAVDFVGEDQLGKDRTGQEAEFAALAFVDRDAGDVGGQQVAGELDAREGETEQSRQRVGQVVLPTPGRSSISR